MCVQLFWILTEDLNKENQSPQTSFENHHHVLSGIVLLRRIINVRVYGFELLLDRKSDGG